MKNNFPTMRRCFISVSLLVLACLLCGFSQAMQTVLFSKKKPSNGGVALNVALASTQRCDPETAACVTGANNFTSQTVCTGATPCDVAVVVIYQPSSGGSVEPTISINGSSLGSAIQSNSSAATVGGAYIFYKSNFGSSTATITYTSTGSDFLRLRTAVYSVYNSTTKSGGVDSTTTGLSQVINHPNYFVIAGEIGGVVATPSCSGTNLTLDVNIIVGGVQASCLGSTHTIASGSATYALPYGRTETSSGVYEVFEP